MDFCEHGNELSNSVTGGEFLVELSDSWLLKRELCSMELLLTSSVICLKCVSTKYFHLTVDLLVTLEVIILN